MLTLTSAIMMASVILIFLAVFVNLSGDLEEMQNSTKDGSQRRRSFHLDRGSEGADGKGATRINQSARSRSDNLNANLPDETKGRPKWG